MLQTTISSISISIINHSSWIYLHQLSDFANGGPTLSVRAREDGAYGAWILMATAPWKSGNPNNSE